MVRAKRDAIKPPDETERLGTVLKRINRSLAHLLNRIEPQLTGSGFSPEEEADLQVLAQIRLKGFTYVLARYNESLKKPLSRREKEIAGLVASGLANKAIARHLRISPATVASHLQRIFRKLEIRSRVALARHVTLNKS